MKDTDSVLHAVADRVDGGDPQGRGSAPPRGPFARTVQWYLRTRDEYTHGGGQHDERPLTGYALLSTGYLVATAGVAALLASRRRNAALPTAGDLALLAVATFRTTRTISKDAVLSHLRAPFTVFEGSAGSGQVQESPRSGPVRHAVGELVTCPFCLGQWVGTGALASYAAFPRATRWGATLMTLVAGADVLQYGYAALQKSEE